MTIDLPPLYSQLSFNTPLSAHRAADLVAFMAKHSSGTVVDVGCGWASLLLRLIQANPNLRGVGIDLSADAIRYATASAVDAQVVDRLEFICGDVKSSLPAEAQGAICIGASQIWAPATESPMPVDYSAALSALRKLVGRGAPVLYGEAIWSKPPTDAAVAPLAGRHDEFLFLPELVQLAWQHGFAIMRTHEATLDEWDEFESGHVGRYAAWLADHAADDPNAEEIRARAHRQRDAYFGGYRGILGMAYLCLLAI